MNNFYYWTLVAAVAIQLAATPVKVDRRWPGGRIPFKISNSFSGPEKKFIRDTMVEMENVSCIKFVHGTNERNFLKIMKSTNKPCAATIGQTNGNGTLSLNNQCLTRNGILHELMHVIGFAGHEHNRYDRDEFIEILMENVDRKFRQNFRKADFNPLRVNSTYDYKSVTHLPANAFSKNGQPTIRVKLATVELKADGLSKFDKLKINHLYNCTTAN